jgi:hypothetical protein
VNPAAAICAINSCPETSVRGAVMNTICMTLPTPRPPARPVRYAFFQDELFLAYRLIWGNGHFIFRSMWRRRGYGRISGGTRALEVAADGREEAPR